LEQTNLAGDPAWAPEIMELAAGLRGFG
jgi:hypothetical protein